MSNSRFTSLVVASPGQRILAVRAPFPRLTSRPRSHRSQVAGPWQTHKLCPRSLSVGNGVFPGQLISGGRAKPCSEKKRSGPNRRNLLSRATRSQAAMYSYLQHCGIERGADCVLDDVNNSIWFGDAGRVIDGMRLDLRLHPLRHLALRLRHDHPIVFGNQKPARNVLPKRAPDRNGDAVQRNRPLHGSEHGLILHRCVLSKRSREGPFGEPNQAIVVRRKLWCRGWGASR
jgi:hypothetical protein